MKKACANCKIILSFDRFYITTKNGKESVYHICKECCMAKFRLATKEKYKNQSVKNLKNEVWKKVVLEGFNDLYMVSNFSRVKSLPRINRPCEKLCKPILGSNNRFHIWLSNKKKEKNALLHRLVANAFIPNPENKPCINHINNNPQDNRIVNLEWCTYQENTNHAVKCNRLQLGEQRYNSVFTEKQVLEIFNSDLTVIELACKFKVSKGAIDGIKSGRNWSHVTGKKHRVS